MEHYGDAGTYLDQRAADELPLNIRTVEDLLNDIDDEELHQLLLTVDKLTLRIVLLLLEGYSQREIAKRLLLTDKTVYCRVDRFKRKMEKYFSFGE